MSKCEICGDDLGSVCQSCDPYLQTVFDDRDYQEKRIRQLEDLMKKAGDHPLVMQEGGVNDVDRCHRVINKLVGAIQRHRDQFVDEVLQGERDLWAMID